MPSDDGRDRGAEAALAAIVLSSEDAVIAKTVDGIVTSWNDGAVRTYGYTAAEMVGRSFEAVIPPEQLAEERERHARVAQGTAESGYRSVRLRKDGRHIDLVMSMSPIRERSGRVVGLASISRPVSERERSEERFASLLEAAPDAVICVDKTGRIVTANAQAGTAFGYTRDELVGHDIELLVPAGVRHQHRGWRAGYVAAPAGRPMGSGLSLSGVRRDGSTFPVEVSLAPVEDASEPLVIAAVRDVTLQRRTEAALRESEIRLRQLAESVETVFTLRQIDPPAYLYVSPGILAQTGWSAEEVRAEPSLLREVLYPEDRAEVERRLYLDRDPVGHPGDTDDLGGTVSSEHRIVRRDGEVRWVRTVSSPVPNPHGPAERVVTTTEDITERILAARALAEAESEARAANQAKNEFLSRMSHELRTPLNAVLGFGQLLDRSLAGTPDGESVRHVLDAGRHLLNLINDVLDIARIEARELSLSPEPVEVAESVEETVRLMGPFAEAASVSLEVAPGPDVLVVADRQRLRQVLLNLVSNGVKYNRPGGTVRLSWSGNGDRHALVVEDDGPGIPAALLDRLFVPFDRLGAESSEVEGTGVGLTVTRALVEQMQGTITCTSTVGQGTRFAVELRATEPGAATPVHVVRPPAQRVGAPDQVTTVLYIEDNQPNVRVMESVVRLRPGVRLEHAGLGRLGVALARSRHPDLVLLDLHLPDSSGAEVLAELKAEPTTSRIPVVVLSADAGPRARSRLLEAGAERYLTKPIDVDEVLALLDEVAADVRHAGVGR